MAMANRRNRYKEMERYMTYALIADAAIFLLYLICAGCGVIWLKVILFLLGAALSVCCLGYLYLTQELLKRRSLWMSSAAAAVLLCLLFSLILNYPSPNKYNHSDAQPDGESTACIVEIEQL